MCTYIICMLLVHIGIASMRQLQCAPTAYVNSLNQCFNHNFFHKLLNYFLMFQCNEHVGMKKFCVVSACT